MFDTNTLDPQMMIEILRTEADPFFDSVDEMNQRRNARLNGDRKPESDEDVSVWEFVEVSKAAVKRLDRRQREAMVFWLIGEVASQNHLEDPGSSPRIDWNRTGQDAA